MGSVLTVMQNRYGDTEFPIRDRWSSARVYRQALLRARPSWASARSLIWLSPALVLLAVMFIGTDGFDRLPNGDLLGVVVLAGIGGFAILVAAGLTVGTLVDRRRPRLEQQRYWTATRALPVTDRQQQLLALDAQSDYAFGGWNSSLDYAPAWSRMPTDAQLRHDREPKWQPFLTMPPLETGQLRAKLDADWRIASTADLELFVADALTEHSLTTRFANALAGDDGEQILARISSLTGVDQWNLRGLSQPTGNRRAVGLWAADTQRVIAVIRMGHLAGHLDTATAWELIERAAAPGASLFHSWDDYWSNVRIGLAFWTNRLDAIQRFDHTLQQLSDSNWPAVHADFPASPIPTWLPRTSPPTIEHLAD